MNEQSVIKNTNNWTRCQSKSRPGQYYMFNKKTKETRWCTKSKEKFKMGTPAQDRLKRLQKNLEKTKHKDSSLVKSKDGSSTSRLDLSSDQQTVKPESANEKTSSTNSTKITEKTSTSKRTVEKSKSQSSNIEQSSPVATDNQKNGVQSDRNIFRIPKKPTTSQDNTSKKKVEKRKHSEVLNPNPSCSSATKEQLLSKSANNSSSLVCSPKKVRISHELETDQQRTRPDSENNVQCDLNDNVEPSKDQKTIISLIKGYCTTFFKKVAYKGNKPNDETKKSNLSQNSKPSFKSKKLVPKGSQHKNQKAQRLMPQNNSNIPLSSSSPKGCANERLQRLRKSLQDQQISLNRTDDISYSPSSVVSNPSYLSVSSLSTSHLQSESMDWQPIYEDTPLNNNTTSSSLPNMSNVSSSNVSIRSEHWDTVNENLLRLAADKKQQEKHWKTDYFYFVVDTNVFLENVTFVDELTTMKLCDTAGTIIYIPYCVLQELDKLKIRSPSESIKTRSIRAIHFINKAFESGAHYIQAQSSEDENKHLIKVTSPDDSILNCCLQVKAHIENVMLLTEDINLRNKAMCSDILVSTKSDLISKHESLL